MDNEALKVEVEQVLDTFADRLAKTLETWFVKIEKLQKREPSDSDFNVYLKEEVVFWRSQADRWKDLYLSLLKGAVREEEAEEEEKKKGSTA